MTTIQTCAKAVVAAAVAASGALAGCVADGRIDGVDIAVIVLATIAAAGAVWATPNADPTGTHQDESVQPPAQPVTPPAPERIDADGPTAEVVHLDGTPTEHTEA